MTGRITRSDSDGLCELVLNRPEKLNALDTETFEALDALCAALEAETETVGCVVLRGAGRSFCAGADITGIGDGFTRSRFKPGVVERLADLPQPVIVAVHGVCFTGGLELALAGDFIVAERSARFADTHGKWGLVGAWGMTQRLPRRIGPGPAKRMMLTAREVGGEEAHAIGLADLLCEPGEAANCATGLARDILANSWHTAMATKTLMRETDGMSLKDGLDHEFEAYPGFAPDYKERLAAFTRKE